MDKKTYLELRKTEFNSIELKILDTLRGEGRTDDYLVNEIAIALLAILVKEVNDYSQLSELIQVRFEEPVKMFLDRVANKYEELITETSKSSDNNILRAIISFAGNPGDKGRAEDSTPDGISQLCIKLLEIDENDTVLDMGSGTGTFLTQVYMETDCKELKGVEINTNSFLVSKLRSSVLDNRFELKLGNAISENYLPLEANKVFSNMPLGMRLPNLRNSLNSNDELNKFFENSKRTVSGDWIFSIAAFLNTVQPGKTVSIMANGGMWNKPDEGLRKELIEQGLIEGIIQLPERLLSSTGIPVTILIMSQGNDEIRMVDASKYATKGRRQNTLENRDVKNILNAYHTDTDISKSVSVDEIAANEYILNPNRYMEVEVEIENGISLGDLCLSINRGAMVKSKDLDNMVSKTSTQYHYLMLQNIKDSLIDAELPNLKDIGYRLSKYCIQDKNLIISKISPFKIATAKVKDGERILANGNLYFVEIDESKVNPTYVEVFLQSEAGMLQLNKYAKGAAMRSISIQDLKRIQIPDIPRKEQDKIADEYTLLTDQLIVMQKQIDLVRDKKMRLMEEVL
ncbi:hypothetical protein SH1V18_34360 [Vallitalea longa]|uniref:site-specific DNA-methyltransferase (adenine-specific) n=1 Tax=Vallitalea longa TaxID=2936439 RepID=A0A9W5YE34_9FIRM|nr:N-6 DNA methylase [Vallitalea longa]GKX30956.1 hypothetical protein SH1V18_34360 [Vallitalea longa]